MIDIHTHILPGLDDGAQNVGQSIEIIKQAINQGITDIIATPHYNKGALNPSIDEVKAAIIELKRELELSKIEINIFLGNEINLHGDIARLLNKSKFLSLASSKYVLIEVDDNELNKEIVNSLYEIKLMGYVPIIAHFERCILAYKDLNLLKSILSEGVLLQINSSSIISNENNTQMKFAKFLLENRLVSFIASDCHNTSTRKPNLDVCYNYVKSKYGLKYAEKLFIINPKKIIDNLDIQYLEFSKSSKKFNIFKLFKI